MPLLGRTVCRWALALFLLAGCAAAQQFENAAGVLPDAPPSGAHTVVPVSTNPVPRTHTFWDRRNALLFAGVGVFRALDYTSTRNMRDRGRQEILLSNWVVDNRPLFIGIETAGVGLSIGLSYLMHRTGHHKVEHLISIGHISGAAFGDARNYGLNSAVRNQ